jgi:hypothetical protein
MDGAAILKRGAMFGASAIAGMGIAHCAENRTRCIGVASGRAY